MIPGIYPKIVKMMLINNELEHPLSVNTPNGGKIIAKNNLKISVQVNAIFFLCVDQL